MLNRNGDKVKEEMARIYAQLDKEDTRFLEACVVMMMDSLIKGQGMMLIMPREEGRVGINCCNIEPEEMYEMLTSTASAMLEDLGNAPSTYTPQ
jgi:hypothetical protein